MLIFLLNFWSVSAHVFLAYRACPSIETCSHVFIRLDNLKQHTVKRYITPLLRNVVVTGEQVNKTYQIEFSKKRMLYNRKTFAPIPFPVQETIETY